MVFFMQAGFAMLCAGCVRRKNVQNTMLKNLLDACSAAVAFYIAGYAFAFGGNSNTTGNTLIGTQGFFFRKSHEDKAVWFFQYAFSATSATIVAGTLAERCMLGAYIAYSIALSGFVYPVVAHAIWSTNGFLSYFSRNPWFSGTVDFAGSGVVHLTGGTTALIATCVLGPRKGRFYDTRGVPFNKPKKIRGHSVALQVLGTMILWFGWYGFNAGSAILLTDNLENGKVAANCAVTTSISASMGGLTALFVKLIDSKAANGEYTFDIAAAMNGVLSGLVAITAGCATVDPYASCLIGAGAGWLYLRSSSCLEYFKVDDAVDAIPVHMLNGIWGLIGAGLFSTPTLMRQAYGSDQYVGWFYSLGRNSFDATLLLTQLLAALSIVLWTTATMLPFFLFLRQMRWLRVHAVDELLGLDSTFHGVNGGNEALDDVPPSREALLDAMAYDQRQANSIKKDRRNSNKMRPITPDVNSQMTPVDDEVLVSEEFNEVTYMSTVAGPLSSADPLRSIQERDRESQADLSSSEVTLSAVTMGEAKYRA